MAATLILAAFMKLYGPASDRPYVMGTFTALPWVVAFAGNWARAFNPVTSFLGFGGLLGQTWSLAVEEQFYLVWPALFLLLMRYRFSRRSVAGSLALIALAEMAYRVAASFAGYSTHRIYYGTDTHSDGLLIGCAVAFWLASRQTGRLHGTSAGLVRYASGPAMAVLVLLFMLGNMSRAPAEMSAGVLACGVILVAAVTGEIASYLERLLSSRPAVWVGRRSYGLYLWQYAIFETAIALYPAGLRGNHLAAICVNVGAAFLVPFVATELSYRYVELPALRRKRRYRNGKAVGRPTPGWAPHDHAGLPNDTPCLPLRCLPLRSCPAGLAQPCYCITALLHLRRLPTPAVTGRPSTAFHIPGPSFARFVRIWRYRSCEKKR